MKRLFSWAAVALITWAIFFRPEPAAHWRGIPAAEDPHQTATRAAPVQVGKYLITPLADYSITAVVLSRSRYRFDETADVAPIDLALGWGPMSIASVINELKITQSGRWYEYTCRGELPLAQDAITKHSANTHCLPANAQVRRDLLAIKRHDLVTLNGYLIEATRADGFHWRSSLTRDDTGGGACEVMWVTAVSRRKL